MDFNRLNPSGLCIFHFLTFYSLTREEWKPWVAELKRFFMHARQRNLWRFSLVCVSRKRSRFLPPTLLVNKGAQFQADIWEVFVLLSLRPSRPPNLSESFHNGWKCALQHFSLLLTVKCFVIWERSWYWRQTSPRASSGWPSALSCLLTHTHTHYSLLSLHHHFVLVVFTLFFCRFLSLPNMKSCRKSLNIGTSELSPTQSNIRFLDAFAFFN